MKNQTFPKFWLIVASLLAFSAFLAVLGIIKLNQLSQTDSITSSIKLVRNQPLTNYIIIDVEGAVEKPGVYELETNSRLLAALKKAGGLSNSADRYVIAKTFNLAKKLTDEEKIYIPFMEEREAQVLGVWTNQLTNVNSASLTQLELLPGIGPVRAQKIIDNRPYSLLEELVSKKVLGQATFTKLNGLIGL